MRFATKETLKDILFGFIIGILLMACIFMWAWVPVVCEKLIELGVKLFK